MLTIVTFIGLLPFKVVTFQSNVGSEIGSKEGSEISQDGMSEFE